MKKQKIDAAMNREGSALIVVLWVVGLLSLLVASFAFDAHIEARITSYYRKRAQASCLAESGTAIAELLMFRSATLSPDAEPEEDDRWFDAAKRLKEMNAVTVTEKLGEGAVTVALVPEEARRNVNNLGENGAEMERNLERILEAGGIPEEMWPELIESFLDWTDKDNEPRKDGAETDDYYATLDPPRMAKNGPLDTVGELLLIKGFSREMLHGGMIDMGIEGEDLVSVRGIERLLTVYGDGKVNVNAASDDVLMTLPGVDDLTAADIIAERQGWVDDKGKAEEAPFKSVDDLFSRVAGLDNAVRKYVTTDSKTYRITSDGTVHGVTRSVWCIVRYAEKKMTILRWREEG